MADYENCRQEVGPDLGGARALVLQPFGKMNSNSFVSLRVSVAQVLRNRYKTGPLGPILPKRLQTDTFAPSPKPQNPGGHGSPLSNTVSVFNALDNLGPPIVGPRIGSVQGNRLATFWEYEVQ